MMDRSDLEITKMAMDIVTDPIKLMRMSNAATRNSDTQEIARAGFTVAAITAKALIRKAREENPEIDLKDAEWAMQLEDLSTEELAEESKKEGLAATISRMMRGYRIIRRLAQKELEEMK